MSTFFKILLGLGGVGVLFAIVSVITKFKLGDLTGNRFHIFKQKRQKEDREEIAKMVVKQLVSKKKIEENEALAPKQRDEIIAIKKEGIKKIKKILETNNLEELAKKEDELW